MIHFRISDKYTSLLLLGWCGWLIWLCHVKCKCKAKNQPKLKLI